MSLFTESFATTYANHIYTGLPELNQFWQNGLQSLVQYWPISDMFTGGRDDLNNVRQSLGGPLRECGDGSLPPVVLHGPLWQSTRCNSAPFPCFSRRSGARGQPFSSWPAVAQDVLVCLPLPASAEVAMADLSAGFQRCFLKAW